MRQATVILATIGVAAALAQYSTLALMLWSATIAIGLTAIVTSR